jgi:hypothetical protein
MPEPSGDASVLGLPFTLQAQMAKTGSQTLVATPMRQTTDPAARTHPLLEISPLSRYTNRFTKQNIIKSLKGLNHLG